MKWILLIAALLILAGSASAEVVSDARVRPDTRVRVMAPTVAKGYVEGALAAMGADTLMLDLGWGTPLAISRSSIVRMEAYRGRKTNMGKGALFGFLGGAAIGGVLLVVVETRSEDVALLEGVAPVVIGIFGAGGAIVGTLIGATIRTDKWETIPIEQLRLGFSPQRHGGMMLSASFSF